MNSYLLTILGLFISTDHSDGFWMYTSEGAFWTVTCGWLIDICGNRLSSITDNGRTNYKEGSFDHKGSKSYYSYDTCGSLTSDTGKGINRIEYDVNGMPSFIKFTNGNETEYVYTSDGVKLKTIHRTAVAGIPDERDMPRLTPQQILSADSTMYIGNFEFYNTLSSNGKYYFPNGFVSLLDGNHLKYNFMATDHLGNARAVISTTNYSDEHRIEQKNSYYAYGGIMDDVSEGADVQTHKYNGKELDRMHGLDWYDYHARQYDGIVNQFWSMDPHCERYYNVSPYSYCHGNPIIRIDPDGKDDFELSKNGKLILTRVGGNLDNIKYGDKSFSISHGAFGATTKKMIGKDFSKNNATFVNVKDGLKFMRTVSKYTGKELSGVGISSKGSNLVKRLEISSWNNNGITTNSKGGLSNAAKGSYTINSNERVKYAIHTHTPIKGYPGSGSNTPSSQDMIGRGNFPNGTMHLITTTSNDKTYNFTNYNPDKKIQELPTESGILY